MLKNWWWQGRNLKILEVEDRFYLGKKFQDGTGTIIKMYLV